MKAFAASLVLCAVAAVSGAKVSLADIKKGGHSIIDTKYIIEVAENAAIPGKRAIHPQAKVYSALREKGVKFKVEKEWNAQGIFTGAAVNVQNADGLETLTNTPGVVSVRPIRSYARPAPVQLTVVKNRAEIAAAGVTDTTATHKTTGVDKLHAEGNFGQGVKIGILDTGIDYTHPDLGGGFGKGFKVAGGYDFVGDDYTGANTPKPDDDPLDQCEGHGTHVAGIIGGNPGNEFKISGVAYQADIHAYRIFGCDGSVPDDIIIDALLRAFNDGMDVMNLSLGGAQGWTESPSADVASKLAARGKLIMIAAGNDGASGAWYTSSPGTGLNVISVASTDNTVLSVQTANVTGVEHGPLQYVGIKPADIPGTHEIWATSLDSTLPADACTPLPTTTPDLSDKVVLIRRGTCAFTQKVANAAVYGAKYFLFDNNLPGLAAVSITGVAGGLILPEEGQFFRAALAAGKKPAVSFPQTGGYNEQPNPAGGLTSAFTTYGPTFDMYFKPAVAAPGGSILSTFPVPLGAYAVLSGTSMATPFMAGVGALLFQAKGKSVDVGLAARTLFETTAMPLAQTHANNSLLETVTHQGTGLVQAYKAIHAQTIISPGELLLNDTRYFKPNQKFKIENKSNKKVVYTLDHVAAGTAITKPAGSIYAAFGPVPLVANAATVSFTSNTVTVGAGKSVNVDVRFKAPTGLDASTLPTYSGWITVTSPQDSYVVGYLGTVGSLYEQQVIDNTDEFFGFPTPAAVNANGEVQKEATNYTFTGTSYPSLVWRLAFGTPRLTVDLVPATTKFKPTLFSRATYKSVKSVGQLVEYKYIPRSDNTKDTVDANGYSQLDLTKPVFSNGTAIPNGSYKMLLRAAKVTADLKNEDDYESWLSPVVNIQA